MAPRALLLSADDKVSALLGEAIAAACQLDRCKDIFSAVEAITRDRFDLLLIDWQETLEADFLLKTARDLKSNQATFALGLVTAAQARAALDSGADAILAKPFTAVQAAEVLLPRLGIEALPGESGPDAASQIKNPAPEAAREIKPIAKLKAKAAAAIPIEPRPVRLDGVRNHLLLQPSPVRPSKGSRVLWLSAAVWPVVIVAALLIFDQWPQLFQQGHARLSGLLHRARGRMGTLPYADRRSPGSGSDSAAPEGAAIPLTGDLLSDYALPVQAPRDTPVPAPAKADDIDLVSVEALPSSSRLIAPVFTVEPARPQHEIPASLRFPPQVENAHTVTPTGELVAPAWSEAPVALPETVSRALLEHQVAPQYPDQALKMGVDGPVVLEASIGKDGAVRELKLVSGYLVLAHAAVDAVKQWRYKPYRRNGENVEIETLITVSFKRPPRG